MKSLFEATGGSYTQQGDYLLPDLKLPEAREREVGIWGQRYGRWLKAQHRVLYYNLLTKGRLNEALTDADKRAERIFEQTVRTLAEKEGVTEQFKAADPLAWVRKMNSIRSCVMEITNREVMCL